MCVVVLVGKWQGRSTQKKVHRAIFNVFSFTVVLSLAGQDVVEEGCKVSLHRAAMEGHNVAQHRRGGAIPPLTPGELLGPPNLKTCKIHLPGSI